MPSNPSIAVWRAQVEKELAGAPFEKLVTQTPEGLAIQPLYAERVADPPPPGVAPYVRGASAEAVPFEICMHADPAALEDDLAGGADALWVRDGDRASLTAALGHGLGVVIDAEGTPKIEHFKAVMHARRAWLGFDPIDEVWRGELAASALPRRLNELGSFASRLQQQREGGTLGAPDHRVRAVRVSSLGYHRAGADSADELALVLATAAAYLRALVQEGMSVAHAAQAMWAQVAVGRDTFGELCKLRALRLVWWKLFAAAGFGDAALELHAVCSSRTQALRDPWVNMLRVTTEVFAAVLGGAQVVTPAAFDEAFGTASALGRRTARNTALVLREESHLGRVLDAGGGSYYLEARTDALAREAWSRFTALEREGGIVARLPAIRERLEAAWQVRAGAIARRKEPILGVSEFANVDEKLPAPLPDLPAGGHGPGPHGHRDGEAFEALRARVERSREVVLVTLGEPAEFRARLGFAQGFFATAGLVTRELAWAAPPPPPAPSTIACLCGTDDRYALEAVAAASTLREAGYRVALAGRPGGLEKALKAAGVTCIFIGCDVIATLEELVS
ncbi:MAG: methylmalonyl-CoA mutase family protein [Deltaproteobacteria bacterium]